MITTEQRYRATWARMLEFEDALAHAEDRAEERHPLLQQVLRKNIETMLREMYEQLKAYAFSSGHDPDTLLFGGETDLPLALLRSRILAGVTQVELARRLSVSEEDVRQREANRYAGVSLQQIEATLASLGLRLLVRPQETALVS